MRENYRLRGLMSIMPAPMRCRRGAIRAYVVTHHGAALTEHTVRLHCAALLESYMVPSQIVLCKTLPRSPNGKVDKRRLASES